MILLLDGHFRYQNNQTTTKDTKLKKDFKIAQYVYVSIYIVLIICLVVFYA